MNHRQLLKKYIKFVGDEEGTTFLHVREGMLSEIKFSDEEWAELKKLESEDQTISKETHSCSCHGRGQGPCDVCKELGCEVWDFNQVAHMLECGCQVLGRQLIQMCEKHVDRGWIVPMEEV